ncbi:MAG: hypothetical protein JW966_08565 [Anaerolineae bacterium]|nr:hypothetical protein [Anaerolineae bacterium]
MAKRAAIGIMISVLALSASACGLVRNDAPTPMPILVTATSEMLAIPIVATETPTPAVTVPLPTDVGDALPVQSTRTPTPPPPGPGTMTPTFTPTVTDTPVTPGVPVMYAPVGSSLGAAGAACAEIPAGGFGDIFLGDPALAAAIGCPLGTTSMEVSSAYQPFENGAMFWLSSLGTQPQPVIYALKNDGTYQRFNDTFQDGVDPESSGATAPEGRLEPVRGFGKVWRENPGVRDTLGWANAGEAGGSARVLAFERGEMVYVAQSGQTYILVAGAPGTWSARSGGP